jgi:hypothetical protein
MKTLSLWMIAAACLVTPASVAQASSAYDGSWDLVFVTQRGACDPSYSFTVNISDGIVTHPNLVRFKGYVAKSGSVRASVTVQDKFASGTGRLSGTSGRGKWSGRATGPRSAIDQFKKRNAGPEPLPCDAALKTAVGRPAPASFHATLHSVRSH